VLDRLIEAARAGESRVLVVHGEPGVGKTALLDYLVEHASGCRVARAAGVQSGMELAFAGLHQLCTPMLGRLQRLPAPQRDALRTAFGLGPGPAPDRFLVALAVLSLLAEVAEEHPLICLVDDEHWLDSASAQVLGVVARRLAAESVGLVFAARVPGDELAGLPELAVQGLEEADARALLDAVLTGPLDARVRDQVVAEAHGNPLALVELPWGLPPAELAGGFALPGTMPLAGRIEERFRRRLDALPADTRWLLQLAAAEPVGDPVRVWRAAERLGIATEAATPAAEAGLLEFGARVRFRHPLARSAAYRSASLQERQDIHRALAQVTDPKIDPDRRAWHRAQATPRPDEDVAAEPRRRPAVLQARGAWPRRPRSWSARPMLTPGPARHTRRLLAAARVKRAAGALTRHRDCWSRSRPGRSTRCRLPRVEHLRGLIALVQRGPSDAARLLLSAARRLGRSTLAWPATRTWRRSGRRWAGDLGSPAAWWRPAARAAPRSRPTVPLTSCWRRSALRLTQGMRRPHRCSLERSS
jgi:hypothetical protein